jgi:hypothetical protein
VVAPGRLGRLAAIVRALRMGDGGWGYLKPSRRSANRHMWAHSEIFFPFGLPWKPDGNQTEEAALR